jgi:hypothetical protein
MRPMFCADWRVVMLAVVSLSVLPLQAQQQQEVKPGNEATGAVGSKVEPMKPDCAPKTDAGAKQKQHPPTEIMNKNVPTMGQNGECPDQDAPPANSQGQTK